MFSIGLIGLFALLVLVVFAVAGLIGLFAIMKHDQGKTLLKVFSFLSMCAALFAGLMIFSYLAPVERAEPLLQATRHQALTEARYEVASNEELIAVAASKPRIELEDQAVEEPKSKSTDADEITLEPPAEPRPDWVTADLEANQHRFTSGPFTTVEQCRADARVRLNDWVWETTRLRQPDFGPEPPASWSDAITEINSRFGEEEHLEKRQTSVGEVYLLHTLAELDDDNHGWLDGQAEHWAREARRTRGMRAVVLGGGVVFGLLGCGHLLLRGGQGSGKEKVDA